MKNLILLFVMFFNLNCEPLNNPTQNSDNGSYQSNFNVDIDEALDDLDIDLDDLSQSELIELSLSELNLIKIERNSQSILDQFSLKEYEKLNEELCEKLETIKKTCTAKSPIQYEGFEVEVSCDGSQDKIETIEKTITVDISSSSSAGAQSFVLEAMGKNSFYTSSKFPINKVSTIQFESSASTESTAPSFQELQSLVLKSPDNSELPPKGSLNFKVKVDDETIISWPLLSSNESSKATTEYHVNLGEILLMARSSKCRVSDTQINTLKTSIHEAVNTLSQRALDNQNMSRITSQENQSREELIVDIFKAQEIIKSIEPMLESKSDTSRELVKRLKGNTLLGCKLKETINSLSIIFKGNVQSPYYIKQDKKSPYSSDELNCDGEFTVSLGTGLSWSLKGESILGPTAPAYAVDNLTGSELIGQIDTLVIKRNGHCIESVPSSKSCKVANTNIPLAGSSCKYFSYLEKDIFNITGITIEANEQTIYKRDGLGITFDSQHTNSFTDDQIYTNQHWIEIMQSDQCNQVD